MKQRKGKLREVRQKETAQWLLVKANLGLATSNCNYNSELGLLNLNFLIGQMGVMIPISQDFYAMIK